MGQIAERSFIHFFVGTFLEKSFPSISNEEPEAEVY